MKKLKKNWKSILAKKIAGFLLEYLLVVLLLFTTFIFLVMITPEKQDSEELTQAKQRARAYYESIE